MITILRRYASSNIWVATLKVRSQQDNAAKTYPAHNIVIWSRILVICQLFDRNDHNMETLPIFGSVRTVLHFTT